VTPKLHFRVSATESRGRSATAELLIQLTTRLQGGSQKQVRYDWLLNPTSRLISTTCLVK